MLQTDTEGLQAGIGWTEMDALKSGVEVLSFGQGTHMRDMALQSALTSHLSLHVLCVCIRALPQTAAQLDLVSLLFSKQTNTDSITCCVGLGGSRAGRHCPPTDTACSQP